MESTWEQSVFRPPLTWRDELRQLVDETREWHPSIEQERAHHTEALQRTLSEEVYPAFEELLDEFTRNGIGGQIYGRGTDYAVILRLDDGFEITVERERYREQSHLLPRLLFVQYLDDGGRRYFITNGIACDFIKKAEVIRRVVDEYRHWKIVQSTSPAR